MSAASIILKFWKLPRRHKVDVGCERGYAYGWYAFIVVPGNRYNAFADTQSAAMQQAMEKWEASL
jgi:hypothetical protein